MTQNVERELKIQGVRRAILADENGVLYSPNGYIWARWRGGANSDGSTGFADAFEVLPGGGVVPGINKRVWLKPVMGHVGLFQLFDPDFDDAAYPTGSRKISQLDTAQQPKLIFGRHISDFMTFPALNSDGDYTTNIVAHSGTPYVAYDGTVRYQTIAAANPLDLANFPAGLNTMQDVLVYHDAVFGINGTVVANNQALTSAKITRTEIEALTDLLPHDLCKPRQIYRLKSTRSVVTQSELVRDMRQFESTPAPIGIPTRLKRNRIIVADTQWRVEGGRFRIDKGRRLITMKEANLKASKA